MKSLAMVWRFLNLLPVYSSFWAITRSALVPGIIIILMLIAGSSIIEQWNAIFTQLFYGAYLAVLYYFTHYNAISIDGRLNRLT